MDAARNLSPSQILRQVSFYEDECGILVGIPLEIDTVEVSIFLRKYPNQTRVSLRSGHIDVSRIASIFGGGGHINAAGITTAMPYEELKEKLIKEVGKSINEWNNCHR